MLQRLRGFMRTVLYTGLILVATAASSQAAEINGDWLVEEGLAQVRIVDCGPSKWGVIAWEKRPGGIDKENPDASKKGRPTLGMPTLLNMKRKAGTEEWHGSVYNSQDGKTYDSSIKLLSADKLEIKGCVLGFLCGGQTWTKVAEPALPPGAPKAGPTTPTGQKAAAPAPTPTAAPKTAAPAPAAKTGATGIAAGSKTGTASANPLDDICAIPEIAQTMAPTPPGGKAR